MVLLGVDGRWYSTSVCVFSVWVSPRSWFKARRGSQGPDGWSRDPWDYFPNPGILVIGRGRKPQVGGMILVCAIIHLPFLSKWGEPPRSCAHDKPRRRGKTSGVLSPSRDGLPACRQGFWRQTLDLDLVDCNVLRLFQS